MGFKKLYRIRILFSYHFLFGIDELYDIKGCMCELGFLTFKIVICIKYASKVIGN